MQGLAMGLDVHLSIPKVIDRTITNMDVTLNDTIPGYHYTYSFWAGRNIMGLSPKYLGSVTKGNLTSGSAVHHIPVTLNDLPFDGFNYTAAIWVKEYDTHGVATGDWAQNWTSFNISYPDTGKTYQLSLTGMDPRYLSIYGGDAAKYQRFQFNMSCIKKDASYGWFADVISIPVYVFITDNTSHRNLIAWGSDTATWNERTNVYLTNATYWGNHVSMLTYTTPLTAQYGTKYITVDEKWKFNYYSSYYVYIGVKHADYPSIGITYDGTSYPMNFSVSTVGGYYVAESTVTEGGSTFVGSVVYFETNPSIYGPHGTNMLFTPSGFGVLVDNYGMSIGLPFFSVIIAFLVVGICCFSIFSIAARFDLAIPNVVYGIAVIAGMTLDLMLGLILLWMFVLFCLVVALVCFLTFREQIEGIFGDVQGVPMQMRNTALAREGISLESRLRNLWAARKPLAADVGVSRKRRYLRPKLRDQRAWMKTYESGFEHEEMPRKITGHATARPMPQRLEPLSEVERQQQKRRQELIDKEISQNGNGRIIQEYPHGSLVKQRPPRYEEATKMAVPKPKPKKKGGKK